MSTITRNYFDLTNAAERINGVHQFHETQCLCGFKSERSRSRTEHITQELLIELGVVSARNRKSVR